MKTLLLILLWPVVVNASVSFSNNTDSTVTVQDSALATVGTASAKTSVVFSLPPSGSNIFLNLADGSSYQVDIIDGAFVSLSPTFVIETSAPSLVWLDYFRLGFKVQIVFELFGFMIRLVGLVRKPTGAEL